MEQKKEQLLDEFATCMKQLQDVERDQIRIFQELSKIVYELNTVCELKNS